MGEEAGVGKKGKGCAFMPEPPGSCLPGLGWGRLGVGVQAAVMGTQAPACTRTQRPGGQ